MVQRKFILKQTRLEEVSLLNAVGLDKLFDKLRSDFITEIDAAHW